MEGQWEGKVQVTGTRVRSTQTRDEFTEYIIYWNLKEEALDNTTRRIRFGRGYGPVDRQTTE